MSILQQIKKNRREKEGEGESERECERENFQNDQNFGMTANDKRLTVK
jgi:hypothetical protein